MYTFDSRIRYSETDSEGNLTLLALLNYFQDCSTFQSEEAGSGVRFMLERNLAWVLNSWQIVPLRYPKLGEYVTIGTQPYEFQRFIGYRNFVMYDKDGNYIAKANSMWSLIQIDTGKFFMPTEELLSGYPLGEKIPMDYADRKIAVPQGGSIQEKIPVLPHHLDANHHVNNGQYVMIAMEFLPMGAVVTQLRAEYKKQAFVGDVFYPYVVTEGNKCVVSLQDAAGKAYAVVEFQMS